MQSFIDIAKELSRGMNITLTIFFVTIFASIPLGLLISFLRISNKVLKSISGFYVWVLRGTPLLLQIYFVYYGLPLFGIVLTDMQAILLAFVLNYAAYLAEIFRSGIESIDKGQYEGATALGLNKKQTMFLVILPQMVKRVLPPVTNEAITLVKDTALASAVAMNDILRIAKGNVSRTGNVSAYIVVAVFYLVLTLILTKAFSYLEKKAEIKE